MPSSNSTRPLFFLLKSAKGLGMPAIAPTVEPRKGDRLTRSILKGTAQAARDVPKGKRNGRVGKVRNGRAPGDPLGPSLQFILVPATPGVRSWNYYGCVAGVCSHNDIRAAEHVPSDVFRLRVGPQPHGAAGETTSGRRTAGFMPRRPSLRTRKDGSGPAAAWRRTTRSGYRIRHHYKWWHAAGRPGRSSMRGRTRGRFSRQDLPAEIRSRNDPAAGVSYSSTAVAQHVQRKRRLSNSPVPSGIPISTITTIGAWGQSRRPRRMPDRQRKTALQNCR